MQENIYIQPIGFAASPQSENGSAIRLAGSMVYASRFAVIRTQNGKVTSRDLCLVSDLEGVISALPLQLKSDAEAQWADLQAEHAPLQMGHRTVRLDQPQIMGILNVTPDSFSDGGEFLEKPEHGRAHASAMLEAGAAIIDVGGESTRPGAAATWEGDELERVIPAVEYCAAMGAAISVDTRRASVLEAAINAGAHVANDVSAMRYDPRSHAVAVSTDCPVILMHAPGTGDDLHEGGTYSNVVFDVFDALRQYRDDAIAAGIARERIILDPGIGFGKSLAENLSILNALPLYHALGQPLLLGVSRKRMIGALSHEAAAHERKGGSVALATLGMNAGVHMLRVHDVAETVQARNVWRGLRDAALTEFAHLPD
ncbi:MAG: dihydropteroate synthase [Marinomonas sp.]